MYIGYSLNISSATFSILFLMFLYAKVLEDSENGHIINSVGFTLISEDGVSFFIRVVTLKIKNDFAGVEFRIFVIYLHK